MAKASFTPVRKYRNKLTLTWAEPRQCVMPHKGCRRQPPRGNDLLTSSAVEAVSHTKKKVDIAHNTVDYTALTRQYQGGSAPVAPFQRRAAMERKCVGRGKTLPCLSEGNDSHAGFSRVPCPQEYDTASAVHAAPGRHLLPCPPGARRAHVALGHTWHRC
jgi:hypothetical protein